MTLPDFIKIFSGHDRRVNSTIILTKKGSIVVDTQITLEKGKELKDYAVNVSGDKPVKAVLLTHEHFDHIAGNQFFNCPIVSTEKARKAIVEMKTDHLAKDYIHTPPTVTFNERLTLHLNDLTIQLEHVGGHSPGQCAIFIQEAETLIVGDNLFNGPTPYVSGADIPGWIAILTKLYAMDPKVVIPGHGEIGDKSLLTKQRDWLESFLGLAQESAKAGLSRSEAVDKIMASLPADPARRLVLKAGVSQIYKSMGF